jgi:high-affinity nickel permease
MSSLDQLISGLAHGGGFGVVLGVALLLGLRHASDPDHLVAVSTLLATDPDRPRRRATLLGLSWGCGHATTLIAAGVPVVLIGAGLPDGARAAAEAAIGLVIMLLALRLIVRWRQGRFHVHEHVHGGLRHRHLHAHELGRAHTHEHALRSPAQAYGIGLLHGLGGSAAVAVLLLATTGDRVQAALALVVFAVATALSMSGLSLAAGHTLAAERVRLRFGALAPALAALSFAFGAWYAAGAISAVA